MDYIHRWLDCKILNAVPILGYLILFNDSVGGSLVFDHLLGGNSGILETSSRLRFIYFGLFALGASNLVYRWKRPFIFAFGTNIRDYTATALALFRLHDYLHIHREITRDSDTHFVASQLVGGFVGVPVSRPARYLKKAPG